MADTEALVKGIAQRLHDAGVGVWQPDPAVPLPTSGTVVVVGAYPPRPDRVVTVGLPYSVDDAHGGPMMGHTLLRLSVHCRGLSHEPLDAAALADAVHAALHGLSGVSLGGVPVGWVQRVSGGLIGTDGDHRATAAGNYEVSLDDPTAHTR